MKMIPNENKDNNKGIGCRPKEMGEDKIKPKLKKEVNNNSKINRLVFEFKNNYESKNDDDLDEVCNFSGINNNNNSFTNEFVYNNKYNNEIYKDIINDDLKRSKSPRIITHNQFNLDSDINDIKENKNNINNNCINENININNEFKSKKLNKIITKNKNENLHEKNKETNNLPKNISISTFSFKVKNIDNNSMNNNRENESNNKNKIKNNESIFESRESSKFNFKINDDIHDSEFNDVDFLD